MRVAVIGAGRWGALHALKLAALPGLTVAAVVDPHPLRARALAAAVGAVAHAHLADLPAVDAITIATPITALAPTAAALASRGVPLLVEKPLATSPDEAERLLAAARRGGARVAVGFVERFNPRVPAGAARGWVARRVGPLAAGAPVGGLAAQAALALDWLVHDLDLARWRLGALRVCPPGPIGGRVPVGARGPGAGVSLALVSDAGVPVRVYAGTAVRAGRRVWADGVRAHLHGASEALVGPDALAQELATFVAWAGGAPAGALAEGEAALDCLRLLAAGGLLA